MKRVTDADRAKIVAYAKAQIGKPYSYGGIGPAFDCSELVMKSLAQVGIKVTHNSGAQVAELNAVPHTNANRKKLKPGDVVFWYGSVKYPNTVTHCAIFVGWKLGRRQVVAAVDEAHGVMQHNLNWALMPCGYGLLPSAPSAP